MNIIKTNFNELSHEQHSRMVEKGFYEGQKEIGTLLMLIVSELSEALEADRKGRHADLEAFTSNTEDCSQEQMEEVFRDCIKDTFEDEIADTFIRLLDLCGYLNLDIDAHIAHKMWYNSTRPIRHGKNY